MSRRTATPARERATTAPMFGPVSAPEPCPPLGLPPFVARALSRLMYDVNFYRRAWLEEIEQRRRLADRVDELEHQVLDLLNWPEVAA